MVVVGLVMAGCSGSSGLDSRTGVSRSPSGEPQLHYALCPGERMTMVRAEEHVGGSRTEAGVPIYWQIESDGAALPDAVVVGSVPEGWTETVRLDRELPDDELVGIEGTRDGRGMSFTPAALRVGEVLRGTYDTVSLDRFHADARSECAATRWGALLLGGLAPLVAAAAFVVVRGLHRSRPGTWSERQVRRGSIWVVALCAGTFWTYALFMLGEYEAQVTTTAAIALLAGVPAVLSTVLVGPGVAIVGRLGRRAVPPGGRPWAAAIAATACGAAFWWVAGDRDLRWLPVAGAMAGALVAMVPAGSLRRPEATGRLSPRAVAVPLIVCCLASALGARALLSNSPAPSTWDLADHRPSEGADAPAVPPGRVVLDRRGSGSQELRLKAAPGYLLAVSCADLSIQIGAAFRRGPTGAGARTVVPCSTGPFPGPLAGRVRSGERIALRVVAPAGVAWRVVATVED